MQEAIVFIVFGVAVLLLGRMVYRSFFTSKTGCDSGCGKCGVDFSKIDEQIRQRAR